MIVKAHLGDGHWGLWEAEFDLTFLGHNCFIDVPVVHEENTDHDYWSDDRFPLPGPEGLIHVHYTQSRDDGDPPKDMHLMRWVRWYTAGQTHLLITDGPVYICNDRGDTIEALR